MFFLCTAKCPPLDAPDNGKINCSLGSDGLPTLGDHCFFACDNGYRRRGSRLRRCYNSQNGPKWSGSTTKCEGTYVCIYC